MKTVIKALTAIFRRTESLTGGLDRQKKIRLLGGLWGSMIFASVLYLLLPEDLIYIVCVLSGVLFSAGMVLISFCSDKAEGFRFRVIPFVLIQLLGVFFIVNAIIYHVLSYFAIGMIFCVGLPVIYLSLCSFGLKEGILAISRGTAAAYLLVLLLSIFLAPPMMKTGYKSFFGNTNLFGNFLSVSVSSLLVLLYHLERQEKKRRFLLHCLLASALALCILTRSRTSLGSIFFQLLVYYIIWLAGRLRDRKSKGILARAVKSLGLFILVGAIVFSAVGPGKAFVAIRLCRIWDEPRAIQMEQEIPSGKRILLSVAAYLLKGVVDIAPPEDEVMNPANTQPKDDVFTSGRKEIWRQFSAQLGLLGHADESMDIVEKQRTYEATTAHNVYLQLAYSAGIPAGLCMILLVAWVGLSLIGRCLSAWKKRSLSLPDLFAGLCFLSFLLPSLTSSGYMLFVYFPATFFWLSLAVTAVKPIPNSEGTENLEVL